ncbi:MAG: glycosyltransferase family 2 protein [Nitrospirota bacterium]|nr:glycosyltransferase family 2 protein [Nitrospirota bacterium]
MPKVSVIVPVYNGERYLREALDSVFAQTFRDYEVICVDDGSTDNSLALIGEYGEQVKVVRQANAGGCAARNMGVQRSGAPYIAFLDQDDRWYLHKLEQQVAVLEAEPDVVLALCNSDRMDAEGRLLQVGAALAERATRRLSPLGRLIDEDQLLSSAMLVRRDALIRAGMYDPELRGFEDFDLSARLRLQGRFKFLEQSGMCYRVHAASLSHAGGDAVVRSRERFLLKMRGLYAGDRERQRLILTMLAECYSDWGLSVVRAGNRAEGRRLLRRSLREDPAKFRTYSRLIRSFLPTGSVGG